MIIIGLAGKTGSGKNLLGDFLHSQGFYHYDLDQVAHQGIEECQDAILAQFGNSITDNETGGIDRKKLGRLVFKSKRKRHALQGILYPWLEAFLAKDMQGKERIVLNGALLSESVLQKRCDRVFWVQASFWKRLRRIKRRDKYRSIFQLLIRMQSQAFLSPQLFSKEVDIEIIRNQDTPDMAIRRLMKSLETLIQ